MLFLVLLLLLFLELPLLPELLPCPAEALFEDLSFTVTYKILFPVNALPFSSTSFAVTTILPLPAVPA